MQIIKTTLVLFALLTSISLGAQSEIDKTLAGVEANNTTLKALKQTTRSQQLDNKSAIYPENPQVNVNRLWGSPGSIGARTDFSVSQSLDMATLTGAKARFANAQNKNLDWQYRIERINILLEAKQYCLDLIYYNALKRELSLRLEHARTIAHAYKRRLDKGDANMLEYNKTQLTLSTVEGEIARVDVERGALLSQLKRLNGDKEVVFGADRYAADAELPLSFDDWYAHTEQLNPALAAVRQEIEIGKKRLALNKMMALPSFSAGYMNEKTPGQQYRGVTVGISIPLWSSANSIRQAKTAALAAEMRAEDNKQQVRNQLLIRYNRASGLKATAERYRKSLDSLNNTELLKKALDAGEISLLDYIVEIGLYYNTVNQMLEAERDYQKAMAEFLAVEL